MSLKNIIEAITTFLKKENIDFGLIGAFALFSYGYSRATEDVDFVIRLDDREKVITFLESIGFETLYISKAFSNHRHVIGSIQVDFMFTFGETADDIFNNLNTKALYKDLAIPVVSIEHLVAMKLFSATSSETREKKDLSDISELLSRVEFNPIVIKKYFEQYNLENLYEEIINRKKNQNRERI